MRKQMKLNKEADELLKYYKQSYYDKEGFNASYTFIINKIIEDLSLEISRIDWALVRNTKCDKTPKNDKDNITYVTTLNLTNSTENFINEIQREIRNQFEIARVYMAFAVKMSLRAYYLKNIQKINIYKNK